MHLTPARRIHTALVTVAITVLCSCAGSRPTDIGVHDGKLTPCPTSPNCVSSQSDSEEHTIAPLALKGDAEATQKALKKLVLAMPRTALVDAQDTYLHIEFASATFGFVDDVEFHITDKTVHLRSASRLGHSDLGANRERIEAIRTAWQAK